MADYDKARQNASKKKKTIILNKPAHCNVYKSSTKQSEEYKNTHTKKKAITELINNIFTMIYETLMMRKKQAGFSSLPQLILLTYFAIFHHIFNFVTTMVVEQETGT